MVSKNALRYLHNAKEASSKTNETQVYAIFTGTTKILHASKLPNFQQNTKNRENSLESL